jgi:Tol biopolymer transport system component
VVGKVISHYHVLDKLGEGGMGEVYKVQDLSLDRLVALKLLRARKIIDADCKRRFVLEAKAASALNHPNIVTIHEIVTQDGLDFIIMEYIVGKTLDQVIPRKGLSAGQALLYAVQVADAMSSAHAAGIIHRDLKPSNIIIRDDGRLKVLDFGLAKLVQIERTGENETTRTLLQDAASHEGSIVGTTAYMSPEQAQGLKLDARSDIFSFGAMLYEMLTGERLFQRESTVSTLAAILKEEPKPFGTAVPKEVGRIIGRCLRKDPNRRFQTMADLKVALQELKEESESGRLGFQAEPAVRWRPPRRAWLGAAVLLIGVAVIHYARMSRSPELVPSVVPLTSYAGDERQPSFSPDGNQVAFSWNGEQKDNYDIYIKLIDSPTPVRLTHDPLPDMSPAWSPDGKSIAFLRMLAPGPTGPQAWVILIPAIGGPERKLMEINPGSLTFAPRLDWSPDGKWLAVADRTAANESSSIYLVSMETGKRKKLTSPPPGVLGDSSPAFSADGKRLAFVRRTGVTTTQICAVDLTGDLTPKSEAKQLTREKRVNSAPVWTLGGDEIVYASAATGRYSLWRVSASGADNARILSFGENGSSPAISRKGNRLAFDRDVSDVNIWRVELIQPGKGAGPVPFIASTRLDSNPQYSPDGKQLAFASDRSGNMEIWVADANGLNPVQVTHLGGANAGTPRWSPDGQRIAFDWNVAGHFDVYTISINGGSPQRLTDVLADSDIPSYSHDGKWIYFSSRLSGRPEIWKAPAAGGTAVQVTHNGGLVAMESPDRKRLYYTREDLLNAGGSPLWTMPVEGGEEKQVLDRVYRRAFFPVETGIYFLSSPDNKHTVSVRFLDFGDGATKEVAGLSAPPHWGISVSPDGHSLVYCQYDQMGSDLMLVENFR